MPRSSRRRSPSPPGTYYSPLSSGNGRRSLHGRPPTRSSENPNPHDPLPAVPAAAMSESRHCSFPVRPPTYSSGNTATMSRSSRRPFPGRSASVLLDSYGYVFLAGDDTDATGYGLVVGDDNDTTAQTFTTATGTIKVTFVLADLPSLSYFYVRCLDLSANPFGIEPGIVWSTEDLALLRLQVDTCRSPYFIYRAGLHGRRPSLDPLPDISSAYFAKWNLEPHLVGVLPDGGGTDFVLAAFPKFSIEYELHIFRSKQRAWTTELLVPDLPCWITRKRSIVKPNKVIALQGGLLGFVDLWNGILLCNVLKEPVTVDFVPSPKLLPTNREHYNESFAWPIRDVTCTDGSIIRCVELEKIYSVKTSIPDASTMDLLFDSEAVDPTEERIVEEFAGWRLITWFRELSWCYWRKGSVSHVDELQTVSLPHPDYGGNGAAESPLKTLIASCPTVFGDDIVCLMFKNNHRDHDAWILTVDMRSKAVGELVPFHAKKLRHSNHSNTTYIPCPLNKYLNSESALMCLR
ncbi:hypothetical protein BRADI_1g36441v3 [Brachypodium distachyon]|uniref:DUF1618 domain-containing protein n=1 Tax=Brachypodium distachyon TaxID=15368 RepID=A0A2K2DN12_BRADI|nr:hypothetical protein BRADI_1g36441v3 [Brachypodium distachyon]